MVFSKLSRNEEAMEIIQKLISLQPMNSFYGDTFGVILMRMGNYEDAIEKFKYTVEIEPKADFIHETYNNMGKSYFKIGNFEEEMLNIMKGINLASERKETKWVQKAEKIISAFNGTLMLIIKY